MSFDSQNYPAHFAQGTPHHSRLYDINNTARMPSQLKRGVYRITAEAQATIYPSTIIEIPGVTTTFMSENSRAFNIRTQPTIEQSYYEIDRQEHITSIGTFYRFTPLAWNALCYSFSKAVRVPSNMLGVIYPLSKEHQVVASELCGIIGVQQPPIFSFPPLNPLDPGNRLLKENAHLDWFADIQDVVRKQNDWNELALCKKIHLKINQATMPAFINCVPADNFRQHEFFIKTLPYPDTSSSESEGDDFFVRKQLHDIAKEERRWINNLIYCGLCDGEHEVNESCSSLTLTEDEEMDELDPSPPSSPLHFNSPTSPKSHVPLCKDCGERHFNDVEMESVTAVHDANSPFYSPVSPILPSIQPPVFSPCLTYPLIDDHSSPAWSDSEPSASIAAATIAAVQANIHDNSGMTIDDPIDLTSLPDEITLEEWRAAAALAKFIAAGRKGKAKAT